MKNEVLIEKIREILDDYERLPWAINPKQYDYAHSIMQTFLKQLKTESEDY